MSLHGLYMRCTALLWWAILRPWICWLVQWNRKCGHVSLSLLGRSVQLGFVCVRDQNMFSGGYPCIVRV